MSFISASTAAERVAGRRSPTRRAACSGAARAAPANIWTDLDGARANIVEAARGPSPTPARIRRSSPRPPAVLGLAGSNVGTDAQQLEAILPFRRAQVETDALIALEGALGAGDGAMAMLGTGSVYLVRKRRRDARRSAAGASCSATRAAARASAATCSKRRCSPMTASARPRRCSRRCWRGFRNEPQDVVDFATSASPATSAASRRGSSSMPPRAMPVAQAIVGKAVADVEAVARRARPATADDPLCLLGGLAPLFAPRLAARYRRC